MCKLRGPNRKFRLNLGDDAGFALQRAVQPPCTQLRQN